MNDTSRSVIKFAFASMIVLALAAIIFLVGFSSAYVLTGSGVLPSLSPAQPVVPPIAATATFEPTPSSGELESEEATFPPPNTPMPPPANADEQAFQLFWEVWELVQRDFYGDLPDMQQVTYAAIHGVLDTLDDQYTAFIEPDAAAIISEDATG